ncbi:MAG: FTR1 family protein [Gammaproteobacteria bacterium]|jgi:high-affinity iron transporter|nr:iron permease [Sphingomonas sp. LH128]TXH17996.1 MAG: c-type cytochrome [Gammaproteobacteria bacterium]
MTTTLSSGGARHRRQKGKRLRLGGLLLLLLMILQAVPARADSAAVQTSWRLLDYIAVDYAGAVADGKIVSAPEYAEMVEFAAEVEKRVAALPPSDARPALVGRAAALRRAIGAKSDVAAVAAQARDLAKALLAAYPVPLAPSAPPDLARGAALYAQNCASCHGAAGDGKGPLAAGLDPPPIAFTDAARADQRSLFGLYQVITQGLEGTSMAGYAALPDGDRWALAFHVGSLAYPATAADGAERWRDDAGLRAELPDLAALTAMTPAALAAELGEDRAAALTAHLRRHPEALAAAPSGSLLAARARLDASLRAYAAGDRKAAADLALSAYLDEFEPVEAVLASRNTALMARIEGAMADLRSAIGKRRPVAEVEAAVSALDGLFAEAEAILAPERASPVSSFLGAFGVLLREGLEALLIVIAMIAFVRKAGRPQLLPYVHGGWIAALGAGTLTWAVATYAIGISGASRELTEGFGSLFAAVILLSVGIWMHGKSNADAWQGYIRDKMARALSRRSAWFLFLLAFVVVYREVFETILFYAALWTQGNGGAMLAGAAAAAVLLIIIAAIMLRYSAKLPITRFFAWSSVLIAILAVVLTGKGIAGLQEAGLLAVDPWHGVPRIALLGIFPTAQGVLAQLAALAILIAGFGINRRMRRRIAR